MEIQTDERFARVLTWVRQCATIAADPRSGIGVGSRERFGQVKSSRPAIRILISSRVEGIRDFPGTEWADKGRGFGFAVTPSAAPNELRRGALIQPAPKN